nr:secretory phospholipase A2 receptor-like [Pocillopora verrucosa]
MKWFAIIFLPCVAGCQTTKFVKEEGHALENHVIKTVTAMQPITCVWQCVDTPLCFSMNVRSLPTGWVTCELNNSSKTADPQDFLFSPETRYQQLVKVEHCTTKQCIYKDVFQDGWFRFGSKLLKSFSERKTWEEAQQFCHSIDGELVSITHENENEFISHLLDRVKIDETGENKQLVNVIKHWKLDGSDSDVRLANDAEYTEEDGVKTLHLNGTTSSYATTAAVDFGNKSFTIASWAKLKPSVNHTSVIISLWKNQRHFLFGINSISKFRFVVKNKTNEKDIISLARGSLPHGEWFHAAAVWDRDKHMAYLFLNGQKIASQSVSSDAAPKDYNPFKEFDIGRKRNSGATLKGYLRDLMIIGSALTGEQIISKIIEPSFNSAWIGFNDLYTEGTFDWPNGTHVTFTKWAPEQPDTRNILMNEDHDCVGMKFGEGTWDDISCAKHLPFVCEKKAYG